MGNFTDEYLSLSTTNKIKTLEVELNSQYNNKAVEEKNAYKNVEILTNTVNAFFDGLKWTNTEESALLITLPMQVRANLYYSYDGHVYVCMPPRELAGQPIVLTEENFSEIMEQWDLD